MSLSLTFANRKVFDHLPEALQLLLSKDDGGVDTDWQVEQRVIHEVLTHWQVSLDRNLEEQMGCQCEATKTYKKNLSIHTKPITIYITTVRKALMWNTLHL